MTDLLHLPSVVKNVERGTTRMKFLIFVTIFFNCSVLAEEEKSLKSKLMNILVSSGRSSRQEEVTFPGNF